MIDIGTNFEAINSNKFPALEEFRSKFEELEASGGDLYEHLEPSQQDYLQDLQNSPNWENFNFGEKLEKVQESITKMFRGTEIGGFLLHNAPHLAHVATHTLKHLKI